MIQDALFWNKEGNRVRCQLCPHHCLIADGKSGICSVRLNENGNLKTCSYGDITALAMDPIEKKPLYHYKPGTYILSAGSFGCNFSCDFCQNHSIAHSDHSTRSTYLSPEQLIAYIRKAEGNTGIAFTYNEPSIWFEYIYDTARKLKETDSRFSVVLVTNGYIEREPLKKLLPYVDAMNIDLKSMQDSFYRKTCGGRLEPVLSTIELSYEICHIEVTTLLVTGLNDSVDEISELSRFLSDLDRDIPLDLSSYFPSYKMRRSPSPGDVIRRAAEIAVKYLNYVYLGNFAA
ncbi:MAG: AmmeMemoRadiSam system radical SAM enzyme, partial [Clostridiales bacterium]|nr:AmmeMemoRadiSam system radical SAM enzyme [Clostridiales bacterium]